MAGTRFHWRKLKAASVVMTGLVPVIHVVVYGHSPWIYAGGCS